MRLKEILYKFSEFYDLSYEYINDCLRAGLVYRREFYNDSEIEPENSLMFNITLTPFGGFDSPKFNQWIWLKIYFYFFLNTVFAIHAKENNIVIKIDNEIITTQDIKNKILTTLILSKKRLIKIILTV